MRVYITANTVAKGRPIEAGAVIDVAPSEARELILAGRARPARDDDRPETTTAEPKAERAVKASPKRGRSSQK